MQLIPGVCLIAMRLHVLFLAILLLSTMVFAMNSETGEHNQDSVAAMASFNSPVSHVYESRDALTRAINGKASVICFFNANCSKCKAFEPDWLSTARKMSGVQFVAMDANKSPLLPPGFDFRYFPSVWYVDKKGNKWRYTDSLNEFSLTEFVKNAMKTPTFSLLEQSEKFDGPLTAEQMADQCIYKSLMETAAAAEMSTEQEADVEVDNEQDVDAEGELDEEMDMDADEEADEELDAEDAEEAAPAFVEVDEAEELEAEDA